MNLPKLYLNWEQKCLGLCSSLNPAAWRTSCDLGSRGTTTSLFARWATSLLHQKQAIPSSLDGDSHDHSASLWRWPPSPAAHPCVAGAERAVINWASWVVEQESWFNLIYLAYKNEIKRSRRCVITCLRWHRHSNILLAYYRTVSPTRVSLFLVLFCETYSSVLRNTCCLRAWEENGIVWLVGWSGGGCLMLVLA